MRGFSAQEGFFPRKVSLLIIIVIIVTGCAFVAHRPRRIRQRGRDEKRDRVEGMFNECDHVVTRDARATTGDGSGDVFSSFFLFPCSAFFSDGSSWKGRRVTWSPWLLLLGVTQSKSARATLRTARLNFATPWLWARKIATAYASSDYFLTFRRRNISQIFYILST